MTREENNETEKDCMARDLGTKAFVTYLGSLI